MRDTCPKNTEPIKCLELNHEPEEIIFNSDSLGSIFEESIKVDANDFLEQPNNISQETSISTEDSFPAFTSGAVTMALETLNNDNSSESIFDKDFVTDLDDIILSDSFPWTETEFPNDYSSNDYQILKTDIQDPAQSSFPLYPLEQDMPSISSGFNPSAYFNALGQDFFSSNFLNSLQETSNAPQLNASFYQQFKQCSPVQSYPISNALFPDFDISDNKFLFDENRSPQFESPYSWGCNNKILTNEKDNYSGPANQSLTFQKQFEAFISQDRASSDYIIPFSPNTLFKNDPFIHSNMSQIEANSEIGPGSFDGSLLSSISQDTPPNPSIIYIDAYASEKESIPIPSERQEFETFEDECYDNEVLDPTVSCYSSKHTSPNSSKSREQDVFEMDSNESPSSEDSSDCYPLKRGRRSKRKKKKKDINYKAPIKTQNARSGVRPRRMATKKYNNVNDKKKNELKRPKKQPKPPAKREQPSLPYSFLKDADWSRSKPLSFTTSLNHGKCKRGKTVRQILEQKAALGFLENFKTMASSTYQNNLSIEMNNQPPELPLPLVNDSKTPSTIVSLKDFEEAGPSEPLRMSSLRTSQAFGTKGHRPRHFPFIHLFIGHFEVDFRKAKGGKNSNKIKILFSKRQFIYEFEHPLANMERKMACIVVPFRTITAIRHKGNEILLAVNAQPFSYLSTNSRKQSGVYRAHTYDTDHNIDVTCGELTTALVHKIITENEKQVLKMRSQLYEFDLNFENIFKHPFPSKPVGYLKPHSYAETENRLVKRSGDEMSLEDNYLIKNASLVCSCRMSCRSIRCSCVKAKRKCNTNRSLCYCTNCDNPLNILESCGIPSQLTMSDSCLMFNIYQVTDLQGTLSQEMKLDCCKSDVPLIRCIPGLIRCPNAFCKEYVYYSWCQERVYHANLFPPNHCLECNKCSFPNQKHCTKCHQGFVADQVYTCCPYCGQDCI